MISMRKRNIIIICLLLLVYIIAIVAFHATYEYTAYWEEETTIVLRYSLLYLVIGLVLFFAFNRKAINWKSVNWKSNNWKVLSNVSIKGTAKSVAYASAIKAFLCLLPLFFYGWYDYFYSIFPLINTVAWIAISTFFFTLNKNMQ